MTDLQIQELVRMLYQKQHGVIPTDEQARDFVLNELKPVIEWMEKRKNEQQ